MIPTCSSLPGGGGHPPSPRGAYAARHPVSSATRGPASPGPPAGPPLWAGMSMLRRCGFTRISYNSCRDRHCPQCQASNAPHGWRHGWNVCCPLPTSTSSLPFPAATPLVVAPPASALRSALSGGLPDPADPGRRSQLAWVPRLASRPCCTPGDKTCSSIPTCIVSSPAVDLVPFSDEHIHRPTASLTSSSRSGFWAS